MEVYENCSLKGLSTFGIDARARRHVVVEPGDDIGALCSMVDGRLLVLGRGSNMVFTRDFDGTVVTLADVQHLTFDYEQSIVTAWGGMVMDDLVRLTLEQGLYGLENLSAIPGTVGASAVQNVGAYGAEAKDFILFVDAVDLETGAIRHFTVEECRYGYRDSVFKQELRGRYAITHVHFRLTHDFRPNLEYGGIRRAIEARGIEEVNLTAEQLRETILEIRREKLPEPSVLGNAGSFFKNPIVERTVFERLQQAYPEAPHYDVDEQRVKVPAGWMIEQCGWKGKTLGHAGVYEKQALVLVNTGGATGKEISDLYSSIQADVDARFGIRIEPEVNFIG
jgi:UDP-N-acetylmuramate dehydrogenase